jgi:hypothetical protein
MNNAHNSSLIIRLPGGEPILKRHSVKVSSELLGRKVVLRYYRSSGRKYAENRLRPERESYFLKIVLKNSFMSCQDSLSAFASYAIGRLNFFPSFVASELVKL